MLEPLRASCYNLVCEGIIAVVLSFQHLLVSLVFGGTPVTKRKKTGKNLK